MLKIFLEDQTSQYDDAINQRVRGKKEGKIFSKKFGFYVFVMVVEKLV